MEGSRGPVIRTPVNCPTIELKDLADTLDFEQDSEIGAVYGFEFTDNGVYKRIEIEEKKTNIP